MSDELDALKHEEPQTFFRFFFINPAHSGEQSHSLLFRIDIAAARLEARDLIPARVLGMTIEADVVGRGNVHDDLMDKAIVLFGEGVFMMMQRTERLCSLEEEFVR